MPNDISLLSLPGLHGWFVLIGTAAAIGMFMFEARRRRMLGDRLVAVMLGALIFGAATARLSTLWRYALEHNDPTLWGALLRGGQSVLGGLAGAYFGAVFTKWLIGYRAPTGDVFAPAVALGLGVGRFGCLLEELPGLPTSLAWGISLTAEQAARFGLTIEQTRIKYHPSFIYEIIFHFFSFVALRQLRDQPELRTYLLKLYLFAYAIFRFNVEFVRGNDIIWRGLTWPRV